jgi:Acyl transferase
MIKLETTHSSVKRPDGLSIRCLIEASFGARLDDPLVIIVPPYAKTMREVLVTALYLTCNGFRTWRFDLSNHLGSSDGQMFDFTLSSAIEDINAIITAARNLYGKIPLGIVSSSLGSRVALRALKERNDIDALLSLVGVVNVKHTLFSILGEDLVQDRLMNCLVPGSREVLGYWISTNFIDDVVDEGLYSLQSTSQDVSGCRFPITNISAELDAWTLLGEAEQVFSAKASGPLREMYVLPAVSHKLENNPTAARNALRRTVRALKQHLVNEEVQDEDVRCPTFIDIVEKNRQERDWEKSGYAGTEVMANVIRS